MSLNLYDVNKSLLSASMLLVAASSLYAQNWQSKTIHDGKVSYFRYAEGASLNIRDCNFIKTKSGDIKLLGKCSFIIKESGKEPETITLKENEEYIVVTAKPREKSEIRIEEVELFAKKKSILRDWYQAGGFAQCTGIFYWRCIATITRAVCATF